MGRTFSIAAALFALSYVGVGMGAPAPAHAGPNDIVLHRFLAPSDPGGGETCLGGTVVNCTNGVQRQRPYSAADDVPNSIVSIIPDEAAFESLVREIGIALAPRMLEPAETLGQAGFSMGLAVSVQDIRNKADYWVRAMPELGDAPPGALTTMALQLRKGLPWSFEIGAAITQLIGSEMFALGTDLKWAMADGLRIGEVRLPDVAVRGSVNRLVGNRDLDLIVGGGDITLSYVIPIGGVVQLTPYGGWNRLIANGSSHVLDATPGVDGFPPPHCDTNATNADDSVNVDRGEDPNGRATEECVRALEGRVTSDLKSNFVLPSQTVQVNRFFGGMRLKVTVVSVLLEGVYSDGLLGGSGKLEFDF